MLKVTTITVFFIHEWLKRLYLLLKSIKIVSKFRFGLNGDTSCFS